MTKYSEGNLKDFVETEKAYFKAVTSGIEWDSQIWDATNWLPHRGAMHLLTFTELVPGKRKTTKSDFLPEKFAAFCKAMIVHIQRTKKIGYVAVLKYLIECKRLFLVLKAREETSPTQLTRWHFERSVELLIEANYKNLYDAANSLQVIASIIDRKGLSQTEIEFKHAIKISSSRHDYIPLSDLDSDAERKGGEKLLSYEALQAYASCTNHPIDDDEEIVLRTIDLLIVMGQRANEIAFLPLECWIEQPILSKKNTQVNDAHGKPLIKTGIRYYAEKKFQSRVHWLADQDIPMAKRAIDRLKILTTNIRAVAKFQEDTPARVWDIDP